MRDLLGMSAILAAGSIASAQNPNVKPVGTTLPQVGTRYPTVGQNPYNANQLANSNLVKPTPGIDPKSVVAPYPTGKPSTEDKSVWDKLYDRWLGLFTPDGPTQATTTYTPGISRRNRERAENRFRRD